MTKPVPPCTSLCSSSSPPRGWLRRGPKKNSNGSLPPSPPPNGLCWRRPAPLTMSVDVIETTDGIASSAMSANEGRLRLAVRTRPAVASRWASERGVTLTDPATTIPNTTAAAIKTEKDKALLVDLCIRVISPQVPGTGRGTSGATSRPEFEFLSGPHPFVPLPFDQDAAVHRHGNARG